MSEWFTATCQMLASEADAPLGMVCAGLGVLLLAVIVLGFGPLRTWFGLPGVAGGRRSQLVDSDAGLLATWRLSRELSRADRLRGDFFCTHDTCPGRTCQRGRTHWEIEPDQRPVSEHDAAACI